MVLEQGGQRIAFMEEDQNRRWRVKRRVPLSHPVGKPIYGSYRAKTGSFAIESEKDGTHAFDVYSAQGRRIASRPSKADCMTLWHWWQNNDEIMLSEARYEGDKTIVSTLYFQLTTSVERPVKVVPVKPHLPTFPTTCEHTAENLVKWFTRGGYAEHLFHHSAGGRPHETFGEFRPSYGAISADGDVAVMLVHKMSELLSATLWEDAPPRVAVARRGKVLGSVPIKDFDSLTGMFLVGDRIVLSYQQEGRRWLGVIPIDNLSKRATINAALVLERQ